MIFVLAPPAGRDWVALTSLPLPVEAANAWVTTPGSGAVVSFLGVVREQSDGRPGVRGLTYEAYEEETTRRLAEIADELQISHNTVRTHAFNAMTKLNARSRAHLVAKALAGGHALR